MTGRLERKNDRALIGESMAELMEQALLESTSAEDLMEVGASLLATLAAIEAGDDSGDEEDDED